MPFLGEILSVAAAAFWAVGVVLFKKTSETMPALSLNLFKNIVASILIIPTILLVEGNLVPYQPLRTWILLIVSGFLGISVADTMFFFALKKLGAGLTAVVDTSYTPIMLIMSFFFLGERLGFIALVGVALIMSGLVITSITRPARGMTRKDIVTGTVIGVTGIGLMGVSVMIIKDILTDIPVFFASGVRLVAGGLGIIPMILLNPKRRALLSALKPSPAWKYAIPAAIIGTYLALTAWIGGMKYTLISIAVPLNQLSTIFIFILAIIFLKEPLTWRRGLAIGLAFPGALLVIQPWVIL